MRYLITVKIEAITDEETDRFGKVTTNKKTEEMVNVRMLATSVDKAKENAKSAIDLIGE